jgi:hypothetical protein
VPCLKLVVRESRDDGEVPAQVHARRDGLDLSLGVSEIVLQVWGVQAETVSQPCRDLQSELAPSASLRSRSGSLGVRTCTLQPAANDSHLLMNIVVETQVLTRSVE